ncbi:unnamed protein product [Gadus morhua 'NCC']
MWQLGVFMNNQKQQKPTLTGQRFKTRKRDEKERFDLLNSHKKYRTKGLNKLAQIWKRSPSSWTPLGPKLDYRRYARDPVDILVAGGMLDPVAETLSDDMTRTEFCLSRPTETGDHAGLR